MIEYVLFSLPSFVAGGFALAWWQARAVGRTEQRQNAVLKAAVSEAANEPAKFQARLNRIGPRSAERDARIDAIRERRKAERAERKAE